MICPFCRRGYENERGSVTLAQREKDGRFTLVCPECKRKAPGYWEGTVFDGKFVPDSESVVSQKEDEIARKLTAVISECAGCGVPNTGSPVGKDFIVLGWKTGFSLDALPFPIAMWHCNGCLRRSHRLHVTALLFAPPGVTFFFASVFLLAARYVGDENISTREVTLYGVLPVVIAFAVGLLLWPIAAMAKRRREERLGPLSLGLIRDSDRWNVACRLGIPDVLTLEEAISRAHSILRTQLGLPPLGSSGVLSRPEEKHVENLVRERASTWGSILLRAKSSLTEVAQRMPRPAMSGPATRTFIDKLRSASAPDCLSPGEALGEAKSALKAEGRSGSDALAALIVEQTACRTRDLHWSLLAAAEAVPTEALVQALTSLNSCSPLLHAWPGRYEPEIIGDGQIGWTDGTFAQLRKDVADALAALRATRGTETEGAALIGKVEGTIEAIRKGE